MLMGKSRYKSSGSSILETTAGLLLLVPIGLFLTDTIALVLAQSSVDSLAKQAARAAAETPDPNPGDGSAQAAATVAAKTVASSYPNSPLASQPTITSCTYTDSGSTSQVTVVAQVTFNLPFPVLLIPSSTTLHSSATEPIVAVLPNN